MKNPSKNNVFNFLLQVFEGIFVRIFMSLLNWAPDEQEFLLNRAMPSPDKAPCAPDSFHMPTDRPTDRTNERGRGGNGHLASAWEIPDAERDAFHQAKPGPSWKGGKEGEIKLSRSTWKLEHSLTVNRAM